MRDKTIKGTRRLQLWDSPVSSFIDLWEAISHYKCQVYSVTDMETGEL